MIKSVSLKFVMAGLFALISAVAVLVAFVPTTVIGIDSHRSTATSLHQRTTDYVRESIESFLSPPTDLYSAMRLLQDEGGISDDVFTPTNISDSNDNRARRLLASVKGLTRTSAGLLVSRVFTYAPAAQRYYGAGDQGAGTVINSYIVVANGTYNYVLNGTVETYDSYTTYLDIAYIEALDEIQVAKNTTVDGRVVCSPRLVLGFIGVAISCAYRTPDPRFTGSYVYSGIVLEASFLVTLLRSIERLTANTKITLAHGTSKQVMALSWGEDTQVKLPGWEDESLPTEQRFATKELSDIQDPTMTSALALAGGQDGLSSLQLPYFRKADIGGEPVYVDINEFYDSEVELRLFIILTVPESDFLGEMNRMTIITICVVCGMFLVLIALGFLFAWCLVRPLEELGDRMQLTASLQDDTEKGTLSSLSEIRRLQGSYNTMRDHLNAMKSFLPQSVIQSLLTGSSADDEDGGVEGMDESERDIHLSDSGQSGRCTSDIASNLSFSGRPITLLSSGRGSSNLESRKTVTGKRGKYDSSTMSNSKSNRSSMGKSAKKTTPMMNINVNVKLVTMLALNVRRTHTAWGGASSGGAVVGLQQSYLNCLLKHVGDCRGTVDTFQGDRVLVSFNAVRSVTSHGKMAATAGLEIVRDMALNGVGVTAGISSGRALVGNMGVSEMMKFNVIGPVVSEAVGLERCCRVMTGDEVSSCAVCPSEKALAGTLTRSTPVFMHSGMQVLSEVQGTFHLQPVEVAWRRTPKSLSTTPEWERVVVLAINRPSEEAGADEWMYELAEQHVNNPCAPITEAYLQLAMGNVAEATSILTAISLTPKEDSTEAKKDLSDSVVVNEATAHLRNILAAQDPNYAGWWL